MKKILVLMLLLLIPVVATGEKLLNNRLTASGDVSTDNKASKLISASIAADPRDAQYAILHINDGSTAKYTLSTTHETSTLGPFSRDTAPIFNTDITATITTDGSAVGSFTYIELE